MTDNLQIYVLLLNKKSPYFDTNVTKVDLSGVIYN